MLLNKTFKPSLMIHIIKTLGNVKLYSDQLKPVAMSFTEYDIDRAFSNRTPPLLILHGLLGSRRNWNSLSKILSEKTTPNRKIIALDVRNHGDSPHTKELSYPLLAEDIKAFLTEHNIKKAALLGHSLGGRGVMYFSLRYPEFVEKLIVVEISPISNSPSFTSANAMYDAITKIKLPSTKLPIGSARKECSVQLASCIKDKSMRDFILTNLTRGPSGKYIWNVNINAVIENFNQHLLHFPKTDLTFAGPTLFILGEKSDYVSENDKKKIIEMFPLAQFVTISGAGHWLHVDQPLQFLKVCIDFLTK